LCAGRHDQRQDGACDTGWRDAKLDPTFTKPLESKEFFVAEEKKLRESVDRACLQFAKQRNWPKMSASETLQMLERLKEARDLLQFLHLVGLLAPHWPRPVFVTALKTAFPMVGRKAVERVNAAP
jgi:hypothetical protein